MADSNFQDAVVLNGDSLSFRGEQLIVGTGAGSKSVVFGGDVGAVHLAANPSATVTVVVPTANGTLALRSDLVFVAAAGGTATSGTVVFANGSGVSFGYNAQTITASVAAGATATGNLGAISAAGSSVSGGTVVWSNSNNVSFGMNGSTITASASYSQSTSPSAVVAAGGTITSGSVSFLNGSGVSFGVNGQTVTASVAAGATATGNLGGVGAAGGTGTSGTVVWSNSNNVSFGYNAGTITASASFAGGAGVAISASNSLHSTGTVSFANSNGLAFGLANGTMTGSYTQGPGSAFSALGVTAGAGSAYLVALQFENTNGVSFAMTNGDFRISASHDGIRVISNGGGSSWTGATVVVADSNGLYWRDNGGNLILSYSGGLFAGGKPQNAALGNLSFNDGNGVSFGIDVGGGTVMTASVGAGATATGNFGGLAGGGQTGTSGTIVFSNSNNVSFGLLGSTRMTASYALNVSAGGGIGGAVSAVAFANSNNVSFGYDAGTITASVDAAYTGSSLYPAKGLNQVAGQQGQGTLHVQPISVPYAVTHNRLYIPIHFSYANTVAASVTLSYRVALYDRSVSTLNLVKSWSTTIGMSASSTASSQSFAGMKLFSIGNAGELITAGQYYIAIGSSSSMAGNNASLSQMLVSQLATDFAGLVGVATNATQQYELGLGVYSAATAGLPAAISLSQIRGTAQLALRQPVFYFASGTA